MCFYQNFKAALIILVNFTISVGRFVQNMGGVGQMFTAEKMKAYARKKHYHVVDHVIIVNKNSLVDHVIIANKNSFVINQFMANAPVSTA